MCFSPKDLTLNNTSFTIGSESDIHSLRNLNMAFYKLFTIGSLTIKTEKNNNVKLPENKECVDYQFRIQDLS